MHGDFNPTAIATSISIGTSLLGGFFSMWVAMRSRNGVTANRDKSVSTLFGIAILLILFNTIAAGLFAAWGMAYVGLLKAALLLTAVFAATGIVFGLIRGLWNGGAVKTPSA